MIKNKKAVIASAILLCICMSLFFPYPDYELLNARSTFMSFPIRTFEGVNLLAISGSILFVIAIGLLVMGLKKYRLRTIIIIFLVYALLPNFLVTIYQETLADGIAAISYDGNGECNFEEESEDFIRGGCSLVLKNHSNEAVSFQLEFLDEYFSKDQIRMQSLLNENGPHTITIEGNQSKPIDLMELIKVSGIRNHVHNGTSNYIHFKIMDGESSRIL
ncbi:hypothetical protein ACOJQI_12260 [Bacillus salacetis]|uniref:hypothetical protein n=1 Tax=Bacillus salacetis TaxID=2315464 RepID=UPI003B9E9DEC